MDTGDLFLCIVIILILVGIYLYKIAKFKKTDYYQSTNNSYLKVKANKGLYGEYLTSMYLSKLDGHKRMVYNCYLQKKNGETTEVDIILIHSSGIYVFESKNYGGWIFGSEESQKWTQTFKNGEKNSFFNPILQNRGHINNLNQFICNDGSLPVYSVIVLSDRCTIKKMDTVTPVIHRARVLQKVNDISEKTPNALSTEKIDELYELLYPLTNVDETVKKKHIADIKAKYN